MSQSQVSGLVVGCSLFAGLYILPCRLVYHNPKALALFVAGFVVNVLVIGLATGLTRNQWAPTPKAFCGRSSADFALCDYNAACVNNRCICNRDYVGNGITCRDDSDSSSSSSASDTGLGVTIFFVVVV
jgi:hypothetical protein